MAHSMISVLDRSFWFGVGAFTDVTHIRTAQECLANAAAARAAARTSPYPLRCVAQAAWWSAAAERCPPAAGALSGPAPGRAR